MEATPLPPRIRHRDTPEPSPRSESPRSRDDKDATGARAARRIADRDGTGDGGGQTRACGWNDGGPVGGAWAFLLALTAIAGGVDAVGYLGLGRIFTANMTGNTVQLGIALARADGGQALRTGVALGGFALGVALGARLAARHPRGQLWSWSIGAVLAAELATIAAVALAWWALGPATIAAAPLAAIAALALAMGLQSAAARRLGVQGVATTYVTGTLVAVVAGVAGQRRGERREEAAPPPNLGGQATGWAIYALGAAGGALLADRWPVVALMPPLLALGLTIAGAAIAARPRR